ncbi:hypothetical protein AFLA_012172 [Aspergillus flavus NRRL3357]|nr:hypothetical protein AFLA_012172 [Aspergillus flavus NRRL3357]
MISRTNPACGTCRKKCRKCDRARPVCNRCRVKGLHCEGYPPRFLFFQDQLNSKGHEQNNPMLSSSQETRSNFTTTINGQSGNTYNQKKRTRRSNLSQRKPDNASNATTASNNTENLLSYFDKTL